MITSRYGSEVRILATLPEDFVRVQRVEDGAIREWLICDLRSDPQEELVEALEAAPFDTINR